MGLKHFNSEEARRSQAKGMISYRRKKDIAAMAAVIANTRISDEEQKEKLAKLGIPEEEMTYSSLIAAEVLRRAVRGNLPALEKWEEWMNRSRM